MAIIKKLTDIADAIRTKTNKTESLTLEEMPEEILSIKTEDIPELDLGQYILDGIVPDSGYYKLREEQAIFIVLAKKDGSFIREKYYKYLKNDIFYAGLDPKDGENKLIFVGSDTYYFKYFTNPSFLLPTEFYVLYDHDHKLLHDSDTSDADAVSDDILKDKTAYVNGVKVTGTYEGSGDDLQELRLLDVFRDSIIPEEGWYKLPDNYEFTFEVPLKEAYTTRRYTYSMDPSINFEGIANGIFKITAYDPSIYDWVDNPPDVDYILTFLGQSSYYIKYPMAPEINPYGAQPNWDTGKGYYVTYRSTVWIDTEEIDDPLVANYDTTDANIKASDVLKGKIAYGQSGKVTGTYEATTPEYDTPSITVSTGGLITASANGKSNTQQLTTQAAKSVTPTKSQQTAVASGRYTTGAVTVAAIPSQYIIPSGSETKTANGTYDVTNLAQLVVNVAGGGGLPTGISALDFGQITVASAFTTTRQTFNHKLGVTPDIVMVWSPKNIATTYSMLFAIRGNQLNWRGGNYSGHMAYHGNSTSTVTWTNANSTSYGVSNFTATTFQLASSSSSYYWRAGTYNYIAIKF